MSPESIDWQGVGQIAIVVHDLELQVAFYRDTLGLPLLFQIPNSAFFQAGAVRLMLSLPEKPEFDHPPSILYHKVGDIQAAHRTLAGRGVRFESAPHFLAKMPDHELWMAFFYDPEGNLMALMSEVR
jgi:catechol 2,3-dioxygenase-like lactoylglutathione lyase family enzyme